MICYTLHRAPTSKPHIYWEPSRSTWICHDAFTLVTHGSTPTLAFNEWQRRDALRTLLPRTTMHKGRLVGYWNKRDALNWWRRGCPRLSSYIGTKQIFGYLPATDELVLRG